MNDETISRFFECMESHAVKLDAIVKEVTQIKINMAKLPCKTHEEKFKGFANALKKHWAIIILILAGLLTLAWHNMNMMPKVRNMVYQTQKRAF